MKISLKMRRVLYLAILGYLLDLSSAIDDEKNIIVTEVPMDTLVNLTANNELWTMMLKDCQKPSLTCVQNNMYKYLRKTLDETDDIQFTSYLRFTKNHLNYDKIQRSLDLDSNGTDDDLYEDESPLKSMSRSLQNNAARFLMTHDVELSLPDSLFPDSVLKISPRGFQEQGTLFNVQVIPADVPTEVANVEQGRTIKKIQKFISEKLIYAVIAILIIIKLLAVKFLFILPLIVGAATAKKLLLKILLFIFPALHHLFKFCAYYPIQAKYHHHKHLISHIHQVAPSKYHYDHHEGIEVAGPHSHGPPIEYEGPHDIHHTEFDDDITVLPDDGSSFPHGPGIQSFAKHFISKFGYTSAFYVPSLLRTMINYISHRHDPGRVTNEVKLNGPNPNNRRYPGRPGNGHGIEQIVAKAEKEALIKAQLQKAQEKIREENLRLQEQLNDAVKLQEKLKYQTTFLNSKLQSSKPPGRGPGPYGVNPSVSFSRNVISHNKLVNSDPNVIGIDLPVGYIAQPQQQIISPTPAPVPNLPIQASQYHSNKVPQPHSLDPFSQGQVNSNQINFKPNSPISPPEPVYHKPAIQADPHGPIFKPSQLSGAESSQNFGGSVIFQKSIEYDPRNGGTIIERRHDTTTSMESTNDNLVNNKMATTSTTKTPKIKDNDIYQAASITYDPFYTSILDKIDRILQGVGFSDEPCKERLVCSMYKNPTKYSPHSNLLSVQLSRDTSELPKPKSTNAAVIRFYKYVQAARDGQDQGDCLTLYPGCRINTDVS